MPDNPLNEEVLSISVRQMHDKVADLLLPGGSGPTQREKCGVFRHERGEGGLRVFSLSSCLQHMLFATWSSYIFQGLTSSLTSRKISIKLESRCPVSSGAFAIQKQVKRCHRPGDYKVISAPPSIHSLCFLFLASGCHATHQCVFSYVHPSSLGLSPLLHKITGRFLTIWWAMDKKAPRKSHSQHWLPLPHQGAGQFVMISMYHPQTWENSHLKPLGHYGRGEQSHCPTR